MSSGFTVTNTVVSTPDAVCPTLAGTVERTFEFRGREGTATATCYFRVNSAGRWETRSTVDQADHGGSGDSGWVEGHSRAQDNQSVAWVVVPDGVNNTLPFPLMFANGWHWSRVDMCMYDHSGTFENYGVQGDTDGNSYYVENNVGNSHPPGWISNTQYGQIPSTVQPACGPANMSAAMATPDDAVFFERECGSYTFQTESGSNYVAIVIGAGGAGGAGGGDGEPGDGDRGGNGGNGGGVAVARFTGDGTAATVTVGCGGFGHLIEGSTGPITIAPGGPTMDGSTTDSGLGRAQDGGNSSIILNNVSIVASGGTGGKFTSTGANASNSGTVTGNAVIESNVYAGTLGGLAHQAGSSSANGSAASGEIAGTPGLGNAHSSGRTNAGGGGGVAQFDIEWTNYTTSELSEIILGRGGNGGQGGLGGGQPRSTGTSGFGIGAGGGGTGTNHSVNNVGWWAGGNGTDGAVYILKQNTPPTSFFHANNDEGLQFQITDYSSDPDGTVDLWEFDMDATSGAGKYYGDSPDNTPISITRYLKFDRNASTTVGNTIAGSPPETFYYRYNAESDKMITLKVTDNAGGIHNSALEEALPATNMAPGAQFTFMAARDNRTVDFVDISADIDGEIVSWVWDFDDGNTTTWSTRPANGELQHTFAEDGSYDVSLTVTDNIGTTHTVTQTVDAPRVNANVVFVTSGPVSFGFSVVSGASATMPSTDFYRGPSFLAWSRTLDVIGTDADKQDYVFKSVRPVTTGLNAAQKAAYHEAAKHIGYTRNPLTLKTLTQTASTDYKVDYMSPSDAEAPFAVSEWLDAEIPPPAIETPNPPNVAIGNGMFSVGFDSQTYFKIWIDTSGSMNSYVNSYANAAIGVQADLKDLFFGGDDTLARKYVKPSSRIGNEKWGNWGYTTLHEPGEPKKEVHISAINEDRRRGQGRSNAQLLAKAQDYFDSGGHFYYIIIAPPGTSASGNLYSSGPALANTRVEGPNGEQIRWCQWSRESANGGALTNVIKQLLGLLPPD